MSHINLLYIEIAESLDKIESQVQKKFQDISNRDRSSLHFPGQPCMSEHLQVINALPFLIYDD